MNLNWFFHYPVWSNEVLGGGFWIAFMAVVHVYIAHFAVGGGLFLVLTEIKGYRENSPAILDYTKKHSKFFLLLSAVFGAVTGVGIWFVISVLSPDATSVLIKNFVFGWATEWVFFLGEIVTLFVYFYTFGKMDKKDHLRAGWLYFIFGWLSLFVVNGIVAFMLTPGQWLETRDFWDGFYNPSFWSSLFFRTSMAFMLAGLFGFITSLGLKQEEFRETMLKYCSKWLLIPLFFVLVTGWWYLSALPVPQKTMILERSPETIGFLKAFMWISPVIFVIGVLMAQKVSLNTKKVLAGLLVFIGLAYMGSFEWVREAGRRPYIIYGYSYSNSARAEDINQIKEAGVLKSYRWAKNTEINESNNLEAGREIFGLLCSSCHSINGPMNDILPLTETLTAAGMEAMLEGMGAVSSYMPGFIGNKAEQTALASYIVYGLHKKQDIESEKPGIKPLAKEIPGFDKDKDEYILAARTGKGMHCISDSDKYFTFSIPGTDLYAQLIKRGESPELITDDVILSYKIEDGFDTPSSHTDFWKYSKSLTGQSIPQDTGIYGKKTSGIMDFNEEMGAYTARGIPVLPYENDGINPYPLLTIEAKDKTGKTLALTKVTAPVSTEMDCRHCHGGSWKNRGTGLSDNTAKNILSIHDRKNNTDLLKRAEKGSPVMCQQCHNIDSKENLNFSAAIHGFHAGYMKGKWADACASCHPGKPDGVTKAYRGIHKEAGLDCIHCHGTMEDHALSLLQAETETGKKADKLMAALESRVVKNKQDIKPRKPWINEPDCLNCHVDFQQPDAMETFNKWTQKEQDLYRMRTDQAGIMCAGCHGITHAIYPSNNPYETDRDNIQPMQYQNMPYPLGANKNCKVCHTIDMDEEMHHPNSLTMFRNIR
ncbi:Cytochrome c family protein [Desulfonema limicola]|uniref:Cytochrome c family protein n=1 Tax=Desulfonema limicola TaxID=45656 RepID=A0A975B758_9BACT|nr:cytochrome ubiquinol oxidase subunit I [Desulfonema limicola]QTA79790.1 Cytochrome c family protein [Desulfonema limicola]